MESAPLYTNLRIDDKDTGLQPDLGSRYSLTFTSFQIYKIQTWCFNSFSLIDYNSRLAYPQRLRPWPVHPHQTAHVGQPEADLGRHRSCQHRDQWDGGGERLAGGLGFRDPSAQRLPHQLPARAPELRRDPQHHTGDVEQQLSGFSLFVLERAG